MNGVGADALRGLPLGGPDLARLADAVGAELAGDGLADRATVFATATRAADEELPPPRPVGLPVLLLDVALGCAGEEMLAAALVRRAPAVLATAAAGDATTIARLERALGVTAELSAGETSGLLGVLQRCLFAKATPPEKPLDDTVRLTAWPGEARECVEIARSIQDEAARGVPFDRMAVLLHSPADYVSHLEEAFARAGVPAPSKRRRRSHDEQGPLGRGRAGARRAGAGGSGAPSRGARSSSTTRAPHPPPSCPDSRAALTSRG